MPDSPAVSLVSVDPRRDRAALVEFLTSNAFPFHVGARPTEEGVNARIARGDFDRPRNEAFWVVVDDDAHGGLAVATDVHDPTPMIDLRLAERHRGTGAGTGALAALTDRVFADHPRTMRIEGTTRHDNTPMRRVFRAVGYVKEAHYRAAWPAADGLVDSVGYAILRTDRESGTVTPVHFDD